MANVLIIDDDPGICKLLSGVVKRMGHEVAYAHTLAQGISAAHAGEYDVVFLDVGLPDGSGLDGLPEISETGSRPEVIIITGAGQLSGAELAIKSGAWDYIQKPSTIQEMTLPLVRALQYRQEKREKSPGSRLMALDRSGIVGESPRIKTCLDLVAQVAGTDATVLITGETGTGKELFASAIHRNSPRGNQPFVVVDCAALPETIVESMLFGHEKGAFTGADRTREGLIKQAHGGTLFLDEVGELPLQVQKAFLRVLQERRFRPIGSKSEVESDFRLVSGTNRDLQKMVEEGSFRSDLLFRIRSFTIELPPLRERPRDIKDLAMHYLANLCERYSLGLKGFSPDFLEALLAYHWPGNVRELFHALERALAVARDEPTLFPIHLPDSIRIHLAAMLLSKKTAPGPPRAETSLRPESILPFKEFRETMDRQYLTHLISHTGRNIKEACRISGLSRSRLYELLKEYNIADPA